MKKSFWPPSLVDLTSVLVPAIDDSASVFRVAAEGLQVNELVVYFRGVAGYSPAKRGFTGGLQERAPRTKFSYQSHRLAVVEIGDIANGEGDGVVVIPAARPSSVIGMALEKTTKENHTCYELRAEQLLREVHKIDGVS